MLYKNYKNIFCYFLTSGKTDCTKLLEEYLKKLTDDLKLPKDMF